MSAVKPTIQVACGVLMQPDGRVLLAQRPEGKIAAGYWEFPGGKIEAGEPPLTALARELHEELGIELEQARPLIRFAHEYSNRRVVLDTWCVTAFSGTPQSREQQALQWRQAGTLQTLTPLLPTVLPTLKALALPDHYVFTRDHPAPDSELAPLKQLPPRALLRLRWPQLDDAAYANAAARWLPAAQAQGLSVLLDRAPAQVAALGADGWHCTESVLSALQRRPDVPLAVASVHSQDSLQRALALGFDAAVCGPVLATSTHPGAAALGWAGFAALRADLPLPVFAIGGMTPSQLGPARAANAQGLAGISSYWGS